MLESALEAVSLQSKRRLSISDLTGYIYKWDVLFYTDLCGSD